MHMNTRWWNYTRFSSAEYQQGMWVRECELTNVCRNKYFWNCKLQMVFTWEVLMPNWVLEFWVTHQCTEIYFWFTRQLSVEYAIKGYTLESGSEENLHLQWWQVKIDEILALVFFVAADWFKCGKLNYFKGEVFFKLWLLFLIASKYGTLISTVWSSDT